MIASTCSTRCISTAIIPAFFMLYANSALAAGSAANEAAWFWNLVIALIVLAATLASAALPLAALRQWQGGWFMAAALPLAALLLWCALIFLSRLDNPNSHRLWPFEVFSWAMLNMIYMVALMTYKRKMDKVIEEARAKTSSQEGSDMDSDQAS